MIILMLSIRTLRIEKLKSDETDGRTVWQQSQQLGFLWKPKSLSQKRNALWCLTDGSLIVVIVSLSLVVDINFSTGQPLV